MMSEWIVSGDEQSGLRGCHISDLDLYTGVTPSSGMKKLEDIALQIKILTRLGMSILV